MQYCGDGGACEKASDFAHRCRCRDGYANLLNDTTYPCYRQCKRPPRLFHDLSLSLADTLNSLANRPGALWSPATTAQARWGRTAGISESA